MDCHFFLQGIFPTQGSNLHLSHLLNCRHILDCWATGEAPTIRMAANTTMSDNKCWQGCGEKGAFAQCCWSWKLVQPLWSMKVLQKIKSWTITWSSDPISEYISEKNEVAVLERCLHCSVHCNIICNSQDMETTLVPLDTGMNKETVRYIHNGILFNHE